MERAKPFEVLAVFFQHDPFRDHIYDVGSLFDGFYGVGMQAHDRAGASRTAIVLLSRPDRAMDMAKGDRQS